MAKAIAKEAEDSKKPFKKKPFGKHDQKGSGGGGSKKKYKLGYSL